ncbi:LysR family transcriptional regulator [Streptomyces sp. S1D4-11]
MLDVRRLRILQHLAVYGTVAATADALHLTAPAVSQHLAALQKEVSTPVVEKHGRTLRLTAAGELLVAHTEVILAELAAAESGLAAMKGGRRGTVRISAFASAARTLVPPLFERLAGPRSRPPTTASAPPGISRCGSPFRSQTRPSTNSTSARPTSPWCTATPCCRAVSPRRGSRRS